MERKDKNNRAVYNGLDDGAAGKRRRCCVAGNRRVGFTMTSTGSYLQKTLSWVSLETKGFLETRKRSLVEVAL